MEKEKRTELGDLGEFGLIKHLTQDIKLSQKSSVKGIGDDAAVLDHGKNQVVVSTDMLVEHVHFDLMYTPLKHLGYKAVAVNLSDIYAMNARPTQITVALGLSNRISVEAADEFYAGMLKACEVYNVDLVGGDTTTSPSGLIVNVTAIGEVEKGDEVYRNGASEGDLICVSGDLGAAYIGLQLLEREKKIYLENEEVQPDLDGYDYVLERQLKPEPRADIIRLLKSKKIKPTSMIDVSDGLASELFHLTTQSGTGCDIYSDKIPIDPVTVSKSEEFGLDPLVCALNGGEDYELLCTIRQLDYEALKDESAIAVIGHMKDKASGLNMVTPTGSVIPLKAQGWDSFPNQD